MSIETMLHGARRLAAINAGLQAGEKALVVCDTAGENPEIAQALLQAIAELQAEGTLCMMHPRSTHGENPTDAIAAAMLAVDVVFAPTRYSLSHSAAREAANEAGVRFISMPDYHSAMLEEGCALDADFLEIHKTVLRLQQMLTDVRDIRITTAAGTDITIDASGRIGNEVSGVCRAAGTWGSPPNIEVNVSPVEPRTQGVVVVDGSVPMPEVGLIDEGGPIRLTIADGKITSFAGGAQADALERLMDGDHHPEDLVLAEFGIGLNDHAHLCGAMLDDEGAYGTAHFGFGHNFDQGGQNRAPKHIDCVFRNPTVVFDGVTVIDAGTFVF